MKKNFGHFLKNAAVVSLGGLAAKAIGVVYRIPLANMLGGYGAGLYQMAYPLFCLMLTFSSVGIPAVVARAVAAECAAGRSGQSVLRAALKLFALLGLGGAAMLGALALPVSALQGERALAQCYLALAPAVLFVALIAVLRGYWQGRGVMSPTALSEVVEQGVKVGAGLLFAARFPHDPVSAARGALFAVTVSEAVALLFLLLFPREKERFLRVRRTETGTLLFAALPVMASAALLPLSQMLDSVLIVRLLARHTSRAVSLYGLFAGSALSLVNLPATLCSGLAAASVPSIAACFAGGEREKGRERAMTALLLCLGLALPCAVVLLAFAPLAVRLLYPALPAGDAALLVRLLRLSSVSAATLAAVDLLAACLTAMGLAKRAALSMLLAVLVKAGLQLLLVGNASYGILGAAVAANGCYLVAFFLDLFYTVKDKKSQKRMGQHDHDHRSRGREGGRDEARARRAREGGPRPRAHGGASVGTEPGGGGHPV